MDPALKHFLRIVRELQKIDPEFPLQYALCLGHVAAEEGLSLTTLAERCGLALSTVSRIVGALSDKRQRGTAFGLIKVKIAADERRRKCLFLTARGKIVMQGLTDAVGARVLRAV
ncbi:MAG: helix-turn-helix domain-containing protein [Alphaproteobacteria bacterium]|nr:helix-turn-helix domain-containing protein [Alphaproteobacteria bacterium]